MLTWLRGLALLRHPELVRDLGERRFHRLDIERIRMQFPKARVDRNVGLIGYEASRLQLGLRARICDGTVLAFGDQTNGFGRIVVGGNTWIGQYNNLRAGGGDIRIGSSCLVSQFCSIIASNHGHRRDAPIQSQPPDDRRIGVDIGDDVWLGAGVVVTPGVGLGTGAIVGANAVVTHDIPDYEIWAGVPAKKIGERT